MTSKDKTRQQLVDSMRKTKAAAAVKKTAEAKPRQAARNAKVGRGAPAATKRSARVVGAPAEAPDPYRVGSRVWPD